MTDLSIFRVAIGQWDRFSYRAFPLNAEQNKALSETKLQMPGLALGEDFYPALGGDAPGNFALESTKNLAENVKGVIVLLPQLLMKVKLKPKRMQKMRRIGTATIIMMERIRIKIDISAKEISTLTLYLEVDQYAQDR